MPEPLTSAEKLEGGWILTGQTRLAPPFSHLRWSARRLLVNAGLSELIDTHWHTRFLKPWRYFKTNQSTFLDSIRTHGASRENIQVSFDSLGLGDAGLVPPERSCSVGGVGAHIGWLYNYIVFGRTEFADVYITEPANRQWTTTLEGFSGDGRALPPASIFAGASIQRQWFGDQ